MTYTNDLKEQHIDQFADWVYSNKWSDIEDYCAGEVSCFDDDHEDMLTYFLDGGDDLNPYWEEYFNTLKS